MLGNPSVARIVAARLISRTGGEAAFFVGIWGKAAYELDGTAADIALVIAALGLTGLLGGAVAGMLIDRYNPKRVLLGSELAFVPVALAFLTVDSLTGLVVVSAFLGLVSAPTFTSIASFPPFVTDDPAELGRVNALVETAGMTALITGTAAGAALATWIGIDAIFVFDALTSLVAVALVATVRLRQIPQDEEPDGGGFEAIRRGFRYAFGHERLRFYLLVGGSVWLLFGLFSALEPLFYRDVLERGPETIGWVNTIFGIGLVAGTLLAGRLPDRLRSARLVLGLMALNGIGSAIYIGTDRIAVVIAGAVFWGAVIGVFAPAVRTMLHVNSPAPMIGRIMGVSQVIGEVAKLGPLLVAPLLAVRFGVQAPLAVSGSALTLLAAVGWRTGTRLDRTRTDLVPPIDHGRVADEPITQVP